MRTRQTQQIGQIGQIARRLTLVWSACLTLALALASCASGAMPSGASVSASASATRASTAPSGFVCANPPGSNATYAYVGPDHQMVLVKGCAAPMVVRAKIGQQLAPVAFSPTGRWLLAWDGATDGQGPDTQSCLALVAVSSGAITPTTFCSPNGMDPTASQWYSLIGWASDASFYLANTASDASVTVIFVSLPQLSQTVVTKLTWVASVANANEPSGIALRGNALYYGGYMSKSEGGAWLHRFSLISETDSHIVRLGLAGYGGCQVDVAPCQWTGPWDISRDGSSIAYHNPGPTQSMSDTAIEANTPLYVSRSDGANAKRLFPSQALGQGFNQPTFSPDGHYIVTMFPSADPAQAGAVVFERLSSGATTTAPTGLAWQSWTSQPGVAVMYNTIATSAPDYIMHLELLNIATGARTPLQPGSRSYVWA
jgi:hypothetical protein